MLPTPARRLWSIRAALMGLRTGASNPDNCMGCSSKASGPRDFQMGKDSGLFASQSPPNRRGSRKWSFEPSVNLQKAWTWLVGMTARPGSQSSCPLIPRWIPRVRPSTATIARTLPFREIPWILAPKRSWVAFSLVGAMGVRWRENPPGGSSGPTATSRRWSVARATVWPQSSGSRPLRRVSTSGSSGTFEGMVLCGSWAILPYWVYPVLASWLG